MNNPSYCRRVLERFSLEVRRGRDWEPEGMSRTGPNATGRLTDRWAGGRWPVWCHRGKWLRSAPRWSFWPREPWPDVVLTMKWKPIKTSESTHHADATHPETGDPTSSIRPPNDVHRGQIPAVGLRSKLPILPNQPIQIVNRCNVVSTKNVGFFPTILLEKNSNKKKNSNTIKKKNSNTI